MKVTLHSLKDEITMEEQKRRLKVSMYPGVGDMKYNFAVSYIHNKDEIASVNFGCDGKGKMKIDNIQKSNSIFVKDFKHLGTEILSDAIIDTVYRREVPVTEIYGYLVTPDKNNGNWKKSIPFYIDFPSYFKAFALELHIYDTEGNEVDLKKNKEQVIKEMYESNKEYKFVYTVI